MKMIVVVAVALVAVAAALPVEPEPVQIVRSDFNQKPDGGYEFGFEASNGIVRNEQGELKEAFDEENKPHTVVVVRGLYSYLNEEGKLETVNYIADENGYRAEGDSIPKPASRR